MLDKRNCNEVDYYFSKCHIFLKAYVKMHREALIVVVITCQMLPPLSDPLVAHLPC